MPEIVYAENSEQFFRENSEQFYLMYKKNFMNTVSRFEYTVNMMCRKKFLLMQKHVLSIQKMDSITVKFKHEKAFRFDV